MSSNFGAFSLKNLVKNDLGFTFRPRFAVASELRAGELVEFEAGLGETVITAACCWHKDKWASPLISLFSGLCESGW